MNHTAYDVMREYMIEGAELDGSYQFPMMPRYTGRPGTDTVDFKDSFDRRIKNHRDLTVNFYIHDNEFEKIWNCQLMHWYFRESPALFTLFTKNIHWTENGEFLKM